MKCNMCGEDFEELLTSTIIDTGDMCQDCWDYVFSESNIKRLKPLLENRD